MTFSQELSGTLTADTTLTASLSPWEITETIIVPDGITLTVDAGCTLSFQNNAGLRIDSGGRIDAVGEKDNRIFMASREPGGRWNGIEFEDSMEDNVLSFIDIHHGDNQGHIINIHRSKAVLDHLSWTRTNRTIVEVYHPSAIIQNCTFPSVEEVEVIHGEYLQDNEYLIIMGNTFGSPRGYNDVIDFTDCKRPGPIIQIYNNIFLGGGDDGLVLDGSDAFIEGNTFKHFHKGHDGSSTSNAIATGRRNGKTSDIFVVRNLFYDNDHAVLLKEECTMYAENNTFVASDSGVINFSEWPYRDVTPGASAEFVGNIFWAYKRAFENQFSQPGNPDPAITFSYGLIDEPFHALGAHNIEGDPEFIDPEGDFHLRPTSPAIAAGPNGLDMGAHVPSGASISGEPADTTQQTSATLFIGGPGVESYRYVVNDPHGEWSEELLLAEHPEIELTHLQPGRSYTVYVKGKTKARWQDDPEYATSKTWFIPDPETSISWGETAQPQRAKLYDAHPNPFNENTLIRFDLPVEQRVRIEIFDALGRSVQVLEEKIFAAGRHTIKMNGHGLPSGVYYYQMIARDFRQSRRFILIR